MRNNHTQINNGVQPIIPTSPGCCRLLFNEKIKLQKTQLTT